MPLNSTLKNIGLIIVRLLPTTLLLLSVFLFSFDLALAATEGAATTNGNGLLEDAFIFLMGLFFELTVFIVGIAGGMFNFVIEMFVFNFATYLGNIEGVLIAWGVIRDIANIMLVFGFIFIGINTLLGNEKFGANKLLPQLLLAAVLLNFSLYVTQVVIDTSNAVTAGIYKQIDNCEGSTGPADNLKLCVSLNGITGQVMSISGVSGIYLQDNNTAAELAGQPTKKILFFIGMSLFLLISAILFFSFALMLLARAVLFVFLMVTSPIGFVARAVPQFKKLSDDWWTLLLSNSMYPPVVMILILVALKVASGVGASVNGDGSTLAQSLANPSVSNMDTIAVFVLTIGLMYGALLSAKKMGAFMSKEAMNAATKVTLFSTAGIAGRVGSVAVGSGAKFARERLENKPVKMQLNPLKAVGDLAKSSAKTAKGYAIQGLKRAEKADLDLRATKLPFLGKPVETGLKKVFNELGIDGKAIGTGGNRDKIIDDLTKSGKEARKAYSELESARESNEEIVREGAQKEAFEDLKKSALNKIASGQQLSNDEKKALNKVEDKKLKALTDNTSSLTALAKSLSEDNLKKLLDSDIAQSKKNAIIEARTEEVRTLAAQSSDDIKYQSNERAALALKSATLTGQANTQARTDYINALTDEQFDYIASNESDRKKRDEFLSMRDSRYDDAAFVSSLTVEDIKKVPSRIIGRPNFIQHLSFPQVGAINPDSLSDRDFADLENHIRSNPPVEAGLRNLIATNSDVAKRWSGKI